MRWFLLSFQSILANFRPNRKNLEVINSSFRLKTISRYCAFNVLRWCAPSRCARTRRGGSLCWPSSSRWPGAFPAPSSSWASHRWTSQIRTRRNGAGTLLKKKIKLSSYIWKFRMEQLQSYIWGGLPNIWGNAQIFEEAVSYIWLFICSVLNFLTYEENFIFFLSVYNRPTQSARYFSCKNKRVLRVNTDYR